MARKKEEEDEGSSRWIQAPVIPPSSINIIASTSTLFPPSHSPTSFVHPRVGFFHTQIVYLFLGWVSPSIIRLSKVPLLPPPRTLALSILTEHSY